MLPKQPIILVDLDDTLFQTHRRRSPEQHDRVASLDRHGKPLAFMSGKQQLMVDWLMAHSELIAVTARSVESLLRVQMPFPHGAICLNGGAIVLSNGEIDRHWQQQQRNELAHLQNRMQQLCDELEQHAEGLGTVRTWTEQDDQQHIYVVAKQHHSEALFLHSLTTRLPAELWQDFYLHINGHNLAIIPKMVSKRRAVEYLLQQLDPEEQRVYLGFGDSLSDFDFLQLCDWFGMPKNSQLNRFTHQALQQDYQQKGFFGHD